MAHLLLATIGCIEGYDPGELGDTGGDIPFEDPERSGECRDLAGDWRGMSGAGINCFELQSLDLFAADRLGALWINQAAAICAYDSVNGPVVGMNTACGPMQGPGAFACPADGSIAYDRPFFAQQYGQFGDFAVATILAHEWGHLNQGVTGISYDPSVPNIARELHADCQAGIFAAFEADAGNLSVGDVDESFASLCNAGDPAGVPWFEPSAHGSCGQRTDAFRHGFDEGRAALGDLCGPRPLAMMRAICG